MKNTILIGPTGFMGPSFLRYAPEIRQDLLFQLLENQFVQIKDLNFSPLDEDRECNFFIGNSEHKILNNDSSLALEKMLYQLKFLTI